MAELKQKPEIRFSGFDDDWEKRRLGDHAEILTGGTPKTSVLEYWEPKEIPWMSSGEVNKRRLESTDNMISKKGLENSNARWIDEFSVLIALAGQGKTRGTVAINSIALTTNQSIAAIIPDKTLHYEFVFQDLLKRYDELRMVSSGDGTRGGLNKQLVSDVRITCPSIEEQKVIGSFFASLDHLITLHQREHDKTVNIKKAMLEKMFPKDGADRPEIRFAGFTGAWERRKLEELYSERNDRGDDSLKILSVSIHHGVSNDELDENTLGKKVRRSEDKSLYKRVYFGDLVFNMMRAWQGAIGVVKAEGMVSPAYITAIPNEQLFPPFMDYCLQRNEIITQINNLSYGVTDFRKRLYWDSFIRIVCRIPSVPEQAKITSFFTGFDDLIALHQRELTKLQNIKKSLLEKMFV